jgi:hypothetical protein
MTHYRVLLEYNAKLADDVYRALKDGGLVTKQFVVHGKHIV